MDPKDFLFTLALKQKDEEYHHPCFHKETSEAIIDCIIFITVLSLFAILVLG